MRGPEIPCTEQVQVSVSTSISLFPGLHTCVIFEILKHYFFKRCSFSVVCALLGTIHPSLVLSANPAVANSPDTTSSVALSASSVDKVT